MSTGATGNGLDDLDTITSRVKTFAAGDQVPSADLNAIQDNEIELSNALDYALGQVAPSRSSSKNEGESPSPDQYGGSTVWVEAETNGVTPVVLDGQIDWRDRFISVTGWADLAANINFPGEAGDDDEEADFSDITVPKKWIAGMWYSEQGTSASPPAAGARASLASGPTETLVIYVDTTGQLVMRMSPWVSVVGRCLLKVDCSPQQGHY